MNKSQRQVRYMIKEGRLKAHKDGSRWVINRDDLLLPPAQVLRGIDDQARIKEILESALGTGGTKGEARRYSVTDLRAFKAARESCMTARTDLGPDSAPARRLAETVALITCGCHTFHRRDKVGFFSRAREHVCYALAALLLAGDDASAALAARIESDVLPALGGMLRAAERRR